MCTASLLAAKEEATAAMQDSSKVNNRQLIIYDKRAEALAKRKPGWLAIWNHTREQEGKPPIDLKDRDKSRVWRFEARMGSKYLRRRWEIRSWSDLDAMIGDAYAEFAGKIRYAIPQHDPNRSRWPNHELWDHVKGGVCNKARAVSFRCCAGNCSHSEP